MSRKPKLDRVPSFPSRATLAAELDVSESRIQKLVECGVLPKPINFGGRLQRWDWNQVYAAISSAGGGAALTEDPYLAGVRNATSAR